MIMITMHQPPKHDYPLTPYDEFPVHQSPYPVSFVPSTDYAWDEGYFYGVYSAEAQLFMITGMRMNPNADVIGAHVGINYRGRQRTIRLSRPWRQHWFTEVGPLRYDVIESYKTIRLQLAASDAGFSFDLNWLGLGPPHQSSHHLATQRGRRTTDQTRYNQVGAATGWIQLDGKKFDVTTAGWGACRDHSWGIYEARPPLVPDTKYLQPKPVEGPQRALRFSMFFAAGDYSGHFHLHEDEDGRQVPTNDAFGIPFEGAVDRGYGEPRTYFVACSHELKFTPKTRSVSAGVLRLQDERGGDWKIEFEVAWPPASVIPCGYHLGSWKDGGTIATYHGAQSPYIEWDEFDFSKQPSAHTLYGQSEPRLVGGAEHVARIKLTDPAGRTSSGQSEIEVFLNGRYAPYGFEAQQATGGLAGRGVL
jgi:hypothetical protein